MAWCRECRWPLPLIPEKLQWFYRARFTRRFLKSRDQGLRGILKTSETLWERVEFLWISKVLEFLKFILVLWDWRELSVAEISDKVLLGAYILQHDEDGPVDLILSQNLMICRGISIPVQQVGMRPQIRHVRVADHYIIPGMSQIDVDVFVDPKDAMGLP